MKQEIDKLQIISLIGGGGFVTRPPIREINCCLSLKSLFGYYKHSR